MKIPLSIFPENQKQIRDSKKIFFWGCWISYSRNLLGFFQKWQWMYFLRKSQNSARSSFRHSSEYFFKNVCSQSFWKAFRDSFRNSLVFLENLPKNHLKIPAGTHLEFFTRILSKFPSRVIWKNPSSIHSKNFFRDSYKSSRDFFEKIWN